MNLDGVERHSYFKDKQARDKNKGGRKRIRLAIFLFLLFCLVILIVYFFIFGWRDLKQEKSVKLKIETPEQIFVGQDFDLKVSILDEENADLIDSELFVSFPEKFNYLSSEPACSELLPVGCFIRFPRLKRNEQKEVKLSGKLFGLPNEKKTLETKITFQLENFSSWFKKEASKEIVLNQPSLDFEFSGADELLGAEEGQFRIKMKNSGDKLTSARIILISPDDFNFTNLSLTAQEEKDKQKIWDINFEPNEEKIIDFSGYFSDSNQAGERKFILQMGVIGVEKYFFLQQEKEKIVKITQPGLVLGLKINDSFAEEMPQNFGDLINLNFSYKNTSQEKIFEPTFKLRLDSSNFLNVKKSDQWQWLQSGEKVSLNNFKAENEGQSLLMIFSSPEITEIGPEEEGEINFDFKIKNYEDLIKEKPQNLKINLMAEASAKIFRNQALIFNVKSNQINININSRVKLEAEARYFSDEGMKIGSGPLPPKVGQTTTYFIYLRPINSNNALNNVKITANLPKQVEWFGEKKVSNGDLSFDATNKQIIWQIDSLSAYSGGSYSYLEASFEIGLTPEGADLGQILNLLENINLTADDALDGTQINFKIDNLTPLEVLRQLAD